MTRIDRDARPPAPRPGRRRAVLGLASAGALAAGCGSGLDLAGVGSGGTGAPIGAGEPVPAYAFGRIGGFGSVIVDGIRWDDDAAPVSDELGRPRERAELGLGMTVEIEGTLDERAARGTATRIRIAGALAGPVASVDAAAGRFVALGRAVTVDAATVWSDDAGLAGLAAGAGVEVWGEVDAGGVLRASRVEPRPAPTVVPRLRGVVTAIDLAAGTLAVDGLTIAIAGAGVASASLAVGTTVVVVVDAPAAPGAAPAARSLAVPRGPADSVATAARLDGVVAAFASTASFRVAGVPVDASGATFVSGDAASLRNGASVGVSGTLQGGRLLASRVEVRSVPPAGDGGGAGGSGNAGGGSGNAGGNGGTGNGGGSTGGGTGSCPGGTDFEPSTLGTEAQVVGTIVDRPTLANVVLEGGGRRWRIDAREACLVGGGSTGDLLPGVRVTVRGRAQGSSRIVARIARLEP